MSESRSFPRRDFLKTTLTIGAAGVAASSLTLPVSAAEKSVGKSLIKSGDTILFQGDSITDTGRNRQAGVDPNSKSGFGNGYAWLAAASLLSNSKFESLKLFNRGISGNKVFQLAERWQQDTLDLKPNVLSILIGVNDYWHKFAGRYDATVETYEKDYNALLKRTREALPETKLIICEPFVLRCGAVNDQWFPEFDSYRAAAKRVAAENNAVFIPFQSMFDEAVKYAPPEDWAKDGVHPAPAGASLMASRWLEAALSGE